MPRISPGRALGASGGGALPRRATACEPARLRPVRAPVTPADAIRGFLDAFGVAAERIPAGLEAQAGLYRSLIAGRRMLVVLDNASDGGQVRPLLPGGHGCLVLVTSRSQLTGLVAVATRTRAEVLTRLGELNHEAGNLGAASDAWQQALTILAGLRHPGAADVRAKLSLLNGSCGQRDRTAAQGTE